MCMLMVIMLMPSQPGPTVGTTTTTITDGTALQGFISVGHTDIHIGDGDLDGTITVHTTHGTIGIIHTGMGITITTFIITGHTTVIDPEQQRQFTGVCETA